jgi:hypothetical protein
MAGSQIFKSEDAPTYTHGTIGACACLGLEFLLICAWRGYYMWQNKKRDKAAAESGLSKEQQEAIGRELGERNVTDLMNPVCIAKFGRHGTFNSLQLGHMLTSKPLALSLYHVRNSKYSR